MMRKLGVLVMTVFVVLLMSFQLCAAEKLVASVSGVPITEAEVQRQVDKVMPFKVSFHSKMPTEKIETIRAEALNDLIERAYKICYAVENKITVPADQVDAALDKIKAGYETEGAFNDAVAQETVAGLRASIFRALAAKKAESVAVEEKVLVTDADVEKYYEEKKKTFLMPMQFRASHILIKVDPSANAEQRAEFKAKAEGLLVKAKNGEDFYNLAYYNSDDRTRYVGGDLGLFHEGRTAKPFEDALKKLEIDEISELVKTRWGYHIVKLTGKNEPRQIPFAEIKGKIRAQLEKEQRDTYYQEWLNELKNRYQVERVGE